MINEESFNYYYNIFFDRFKWFYVGRILNLFCLRWYVKKGRDGWDKIYLCVIDRDSEGKLYLC